MIHATKAEIVTHHPTVWPYDFYVQRIALPDNTKQAESVVVPSE